MRLAGAIPAEHVDSALRTLVDRHPALRAGDDRPPVRAHEEDARTEEEALERAEAHAGAGWDLTAGPLLRGCRVRIGGDATLLTLAAPRSVCDESSMTVLWSEFRTLCAGGTLPEAPAADPRRAPRTVGTPEQQHAYWRSRLDADLPLPRFGIESPERAGGPGGRGAVAFTVPAEVRDAVEELARRSATAADSVLLAAFLTTLHRYVREEQTLVGVPVESRAAPSGTNAGPDAVGNFVNTAPLLVPVERGLRFGELLELAHTTLEEARRRADLPLAEVLAGRGGPGAPALRVQFVPPGPAPQRTAGRVPHGGAGARELPLRVTSAAAGVSFRLAHAEGAWTGVLEYDTAEAGASAARGWAESFTVLLAHAAACPETRVEALRMLPADRLDRTVAAINSGFETYPGLRPVHRAFEEVARSRPDLVAVESGTRSIRYGELDRRAGLLAHRLVAQGLGPERTAGVLVERSVDLIVALLAIWKTGAAMVPLDPRMPDRRMAFIAGDARLTTIVTQERFRTRLAGQRLPLTTVPTEGGADTPAVPGVRTENTAYIYYTSGSTGQPKGVVLDHRTAAVRLEWLGRRYRLGAGDRVVHKTPLIFDVAVWEILGPLSAGATLLLADPEAESDVAHLSKLLATENTVFTHFVPSMLDAYLRHAPAAEYPSLRWVQLSGEVVPARLLERFAGHFSAECHNLYGQTETSEVAAWEGRAVAGDGSVPLGRQIGIYRLFVLDEALRPVPPGVTGELCVAGVGGLARGYLGRPGTTAERFVPHPYPVTPGERLYRTGDLASFDEDGLLTYRGRADEQTKIRGCRVETGEVEAVLSQGGADCAVVTRPDEEGAAELVAYVVGDRSTVEALAAHAEEHLPGYMLPSVYVALDALPLGPSGKLDRRSLPAPTAADRAARRTVSEPPLTALEQRIAELWQSVLRIDRPGRDDNFFTMGGNSLKSLQILNRINAAFHIKFTVRDFFAGPTISQMAATVERLLREMTAAMSEDDAAGLLAELKGTQAR
ncbi:non-ribosomal peptide synthetase [Streptomyces olivaceus]|uniref:Amino acid adenylation domain-containing protein n=1 Tax=Streptomyces olivaceus TaxID=47716 RepID=A0ABS7WED6_STROV|nr:amino acid adenylation domain-containing protein [Streptomyces olivaceus]MBZ6121587.1 amino acid adenylation domain-containing protein [Streptomyces olivaceus]MBZ6156323.1 amino acid adenylation domain-containing protein [Streptomyces olivaceus]MBZ6302849.1 amino acid adenylation domain-containing protein [Streptomyces olivaceus]MBZ6323587.1 amino acid adenylation domain-containing protein [Streptomyces olivaceus]